MRMSMPVAAASAAVLALSACGSGEGGETDGNAESFEDAEAAQVPEGYGVVVEFLEDQAAAAGAVVDHGTDADDDAELQGLLEEVEEINEQWGGGGWPDVGTDASNGVEVAQVASDLEDESGRLAHVMLDPDETLESEDLESAREAVEAAEDELGRLNALERL
ncbi:hypothetical protein [Nocardiopsis xinjiangensis]|uniref:hypothetical protein n=1 Tax=Nocardiopsis xinjiangensis TaxID=124285 RepID=UPI00034871F0|nr:hypothetical protein [Nocardiopsis xinjiangensis]